MTAISILEVNMFLCREFRSLGTSSRLAQMASVEMGDLGGKCGFESAIFLL